MIVSGADKILISWQLLMRWGINAPTFLKVMNPNKLYKVHQGVSIEDAFMKKGEAIIETTKCQKKDEMAFEAKKDAFQFLGALLMTKFTSVFKNDLDEEDTISTKEAIKI